MMTQYPRQDGRVLPDWTDLPLDVRQHLAGQTPHRLQTIMYNTNVDEVPVDAFAADVATADQRLRELLATEPHARQYFDTLTFAAVAHEPDPMRAAEAEYYLCDALIEYGNRYHDDQAGPWSVPVLDPTLYGRHKER